MNINKYVLCTNLQVGLQHPTGQKFLVIGNFEYYHYGCDGVDDRGWGCGYRTLQSMISWIINQTGSSQSVPTIEAIQTKLVDIDDKTRSFIKSRQWIGSFEACLIIDSCFDIPSKMIHIVRGKDLRLYMDEIVDHFQQFASPVMMGGDSDNSSKCILGVCIEPQSLLIMDPHYYQSRTDGGGGGGDELSTRARLQADGWIKWRSINDFDEQSFYNLCMPRLSALSSR